MFKGSRLFVFLQLEKCYVSKDLMDIEKGRIDHGELQDKCVCSGHFSDSELQAIIRERCHQGKCSYCDGEGLVMDMPDFITIVKDKLEAKFEDVDNAMLICIISIPQLAIIIVCRMFVPELAVVR